MQVTAMSGLFQEQGLTQEIATKRQFCDITQSEAPAELLSHPVLPPHPALDRADLKDIRAIRARPV